MPFLTDRRWFYLCLLIGLLNVPTVKSVWPSSSAFNTQLLGLFNDKINTSQPTTLSVHSRAMFQAAVLLSHRYNITIQGQNIGWQSMQTEGDPTTAYSSACRQISNVNTVGIVGPAFSREANAIAPFTARVGLPMVSYSATDPALSDKSSFPSFYRTVPSDTTAAQAVTDLFLRYNWTSCTIIYQNDAFGTGGAKMIGEAFAKHNLVVSQSIVFDLGTMTIRGDLKSLLTSSASRIVVLWVSTAYTARVLNTALSLNVLGPQFTWILSSNVPLSSFNQSSYNQLVGMFVVGPTIGSGVNAPSNTTLLNDAYDIWKQYEPETFPGDSNVDYYGLFAFDATWLLIKSLQELCPTTSNRSSSCLSFVNDSFCFNRQLLQSAALYGIMENSTFLGVSGPIGFSRNTTDRSTGNYYVAKNLQRSSTGLSFMSVLVWSDSSGWSTHVQANLIVWPGASLSVPTGRAAVLGVQLRVALIESQPFTISTKVQNGSGEFIQLIGYGPDLLNELQQRMGFVANYTLFPSNQSYNALVSAVANGTFDMFVADVTITSKRRERVAFSNPIYDNSLRIIMREATVSQLDLWSYLKPFSGKLWLILLCATVYAGLLICVMERQRNEALKDQSIVSLIGMSMWYSIGTIMGFGADFHVTTAAGRMLTIGLYILSLIMVAAYTANLASDLTLSRSEGIISGIDDVKKGKIPFSRIGILPNSAIEDYYVREVSGGNRNFYPLKSPDQIFSSLLNYEIDAGILDSSILEYGVNSVYCNLTLVGSEFDRGGYGIVTQKSWLYQQDLDVAILAIKETGKLDELKVKWFGSSLCSREAETSTAMTIESMAGLFMTFAVISIVAILIFLWRQRLGIFKYLSPFSQRSDASLQRKASDHSFTIKSPVLIESYL